MNLSDGLLAHIYHKTIIFSNEYSYPIDIAHLSP